MCRRKAKKLFNTAGLVLMAHDKAAANRLSRQFQTRQIIKRYPARVLGNFADTPQAPKIDFKPDGNEFAVSGYDAATHTSRVNIVIRTGRV